MRKLLGVIPMLFLMAFAKPADSSTDREMVASVTAVSVETNDLTPPTCFWCHLDEVVCETNGAHVSDGGGQAEGGVAVLGGHAGTCVANPNKGMCKGHYSCNPYGDEDDDVEPEDGGVEDLIAHALEGDDKAFEEIVRSYADRMRYNETWNVVEIIDCRKIGNVYASIDATGHEDLVKEMARP